MKKRITSLLLTLAMLLSLLPAMGVTASAADASWKTVNTYDELKTALSNQNPPDNIKLGNDIDTGTLNSGMGILEPLEVKGKKQLDLNGHTLRLFTQKSALGDLIEVKTSSLTLSDSSAAQTGRILGVTSGDADVLINVWENGKFTMNSGKLEVEVYTGSIRGVLWRRTIDCHYDGEVVINGGTLYVPPKTYEDSNAYTTQFFDEFDDLHNGSCGYTLIANNNSKVTINGGTFQGPVRMNVSNSKWNKTTSRVIITGGTFAKDVVLNGAGSKAGDGIVTLAEIKGGTFLGKVQAWAAASFDSSFSAPEVVISGGDFSKEFWLRPKFPLVNDKEQEGMAYHVAAKLNGGTFHEGFSADKSSKNYEYSGAAVKQRLKDYEIYQLADKLLGQNAIQTGNGTFAAQDNNSYSKYITNYRKSEHDSGGYAFIIKAVNNQPTKIIPNAWGITDVTLDGDPIDYAKDWKGAVEKMDNSTAHTIKFTWKPLASELVNAGYTYRTKCEHYISGSSAVQQTDTIAADKTSHTVTIEKGADPKVYSYDLQLNLEKNGSLVGIFTNDHIVKLVVNQAPPAPPEPPAPVAHSITVDNGFALVSPSSTAKAGDIITVWADDRRAHNQMFTEWHAATPGVTFEDMNQQRTTFVMPDRDVHICPSYMDVSFTRQPLDSWPQINYAGKAYASFSVPISKWELKEGNTTVVSSNNSSIIKAEETIAVDIPAQSSEVEKTYTIVVTAFGQEFSSNEFKVKWVKWPKAPAVEFTPADETQFVGKIEVIASDALYAGEEIFEIAYTTDGTDPKTSTKTKYANTDSVHITLTDTTTIKARAYNHDASAEEEKWGPLATATFTKYSDTTLPKPTITPEGLTYTGSIKAYLTAPKLDGVKMEYCLMRTGDPNTIGSWAPYDPETGITVNEFGTITLYARSFKNVDAETSEGLGYVEHLTSENVSATYTRTYSAAIDDVTVSGEVGKTLTQDVVIRMNGDRFENITAGEDVSTWFNLPAGLTAKVKTLSEADGYHENLTVTISGTPTADSVNTITVTIPKEKLYANNAADLTVLSNPKAYYSIVAAAAHTHDTGKQSWASLNDYEHYRSCTAGDETNFEPHNITSWTDNGDGTHTGTCTVCGYKKTESIPATSSGGSTGGGGGGGGVTSSYAITVNSAKNGGVTASHKTASEGTTVTLTVTPDKGYVLDTLTVLDSKNKAVKLTEKNGKYTFTMPAGKVTVSAAFKAAAPASENPFTDVPSGAYYEDAVIWAVKKDITSGTSATTFDPGGNCTRAQAVTFLWRAAGSPEPKSAAMPFTDVPAGSYFEKAVLWAVENGITKGTSDTTFSPDASCTRAQIVTFLWRAGGSPAVSGNSAFSDVASDAYYAAAVAWAEKNGVTGGIGGGLFGSDNTCTRAQIVTFIYRSVK